MPMGDRQIAFGGLHAFILRERLETAHGLLSSGRVGSCGFASLYTFNRQFKRRYGDTPSSL
jgi:transcriptional regulator GlxA family with amidase domain